MIYIYIYIQFFWNIFRWRIYESMMENYVENVSPNLLLTVHCFSIQCRNGQLIYYPTLLLYVLSIRTAFSIKKENWWFHLMYLFFISLSLFLLPIALFNKNSLPVFFFSGIKLLIQNSSSKKKAKHLIELMQSSKREGTAKKKTKLPL